MVGDEQRSHGSNGQMTMIEPDTRLAVGDVMPDVELRDLDGNVRRLSGSRGRPLLIFMWASW